jgi:hypothetical protein
MSESSSLEDLRESTTIPPTRRDASVVRSPDLSDDSYDDFADNYYQSNVRLNRESMDRMLDEAFGKLVSSDPQFRELTKSTPILDVWKTKR